MDSFRRTSLASVAVALCLAVLGNEAGAQSLTGALVGTIKDPQGGVLPNTAVTLASHALLTGEQRTTANDKGQWRFHLLPPGTYEVTVDLAPTFKPYRKSDIAIGAGDTMDLTVVLQIAGVAETVTVAADEGISSRRTGLETRFGPEHIQTIPSRRFSMFDLIRSTPGVSPSSPGSGTVNSVSVFGSAVNENMFLIDGTNFTCPCQGVSRSEPMVDVIQELHVQTMGASVEYGNVQGGVINVITKQGGPRLAGETSYYAQPSIFTAQPVVLPVRRGTVPASGYERVRYRDLSTSVGGPVKRNRAWFFGAYQYLRDFDSQPGTDPAFPRKYEQNKVFGKLTSQLTQSLQMMQSFHQENWVNPTAPTLVSPFVTTQRVHAQVPSATLANLTQALSNRTAWEARVGRFTLDQDLDPSSGDRLTPFRRDQSTGLSSGNASQMGGLMLDRLTAKAVLHRYQPGSLGTEHHVKIGTQFERGEHRLRQAFPGGVQFSDNNGPSEAIFRGPSIAGGVFITTALFVSDSVTFNDRVTADAGLRFDHTRAISQALPAVDAAGNETDAVIPGLGTLYTFNMLSPRLGVTMKLDRRGRTVLRANYGRFNQGVLTGELDPVSPGIATTTTMAYNPATGGYDHHVSVVDPRSNLALDPGTRSPHTDEWSLALEREIAPRLKASAAFIRKRGADFIGWTDTGGEYRPETRPLAGGGSLPVLILTNRASDRRFLLTNPRELFLEYDGVVLAVEKRLSHRWQASGSYTRSRTHGLQVVSNGAADVPQFSTIARPGFLTFGQDPNDLTNATGRLPNDRPNVIRATGVLHLWRGLLIAANMQHFSGKPWAATAQVPLAQGQGNRRVMLEPRGSRRLSSQSLVDFRMSKAVRVPKMGKVDFSMDVLNLLNDRAEEAIATDTLLAPTFGRPTQFIDPRRVMFGARLTLGR